MTDLVPLPRRGRYFGLRSTLLGLVGLAGSFAAAATMDRFRAQGQEAAGFALVFAAVSALALLSSLILNRQWEPPTHGESPLPFAALVRLPLAHAGSRRFLGFLLFWSIATGIAGPFFGAHMLKNLKMSYTGIAVYGAIVMVGSVGSQLIWGRIIDRIGCLRVLTLNQIGVALLPLLWLFATPGFLLPIWIDAFLTGLFWPGFNLAQFNLTLLMAPKENRSAYLAMQSVVGGFACFAAALLAGALADALAGFTVAVGKQVLLNFHLLFFMTAGLRLLLLPMSRALRLPGGGKNPRTGTPSPPSNC
jgi:MFS family permease